MKKIFLVLACLSLTACPHAPATPIPAKNGKQAFFIECFGGLNSWTTCYKKANEVCGGKYTVLSKNQGKEASFSSAAGGGPNNWGAGSTGSVGHDRSMSVVCN